ncbi:MAG: hypothetical protein RMI91_06965 [Gemmatales bacterium]|nr:hypothetical protein [Gemmatales bacterium]
MTARNFFGWGLACLLLSIGVTSPAKPPHTDAQKKGMRQWLAEYFAKRWHDATYDTELYDLIIEKKRARELVPALLEYRVKDVRDEVPGLQFECAIAQICMLDSYRSELRLELVNHLAVRPDGELEVDYLGNTSVASVAYYLLILMDKMQEVPWALNPWTSRKLNASLPSKTPEPTDETRLVAIYEPIVRRYHERVPPPLVEYLYREYGYKAWHVFHGASSKKTDEVRRFQWSAHLIETTAWRILNDHKDKAEVAAAAKEIERLVSHEAWYTRRYAVHVLIKYPFFRTPELVKKLQNDPHPLVRERAKYIKIDD